MRHIILISIFFLSQQLAFSQEWLELYQQSLELNKQGEFTNAFNRAENALQLYLQQDGTPNNNYLSLLRNATTNAFVAEEPTKGIEFAQREIKLREELNMPKDQAYAMAMYNLGSLFYIIENYTEAINALSTSLKITEDYFSKSDEEWLECKWKIASAYYLSGNVEQANAQFDESFTYVNDYTDLTTDYLAALYYVSQIKTDLQKHQDALKHLLVLEEIYSANSMDNDTEYADILSLIAYNYQSINKFDEAEAYFLRALPALEKHRGKNSKGYVNALNRRAANLENLGRGAEAQSLVAQISIEDADAGTLNNMAAISQSRGDFEKAEGFYKQALARYNTENVTEQLGWAETAENLSQLYIELNRFKEAEELLKQSAVIISQRYGTSHERYASTLQKQAVLLRNQSRFDEAGLLYVTAAEIYKAKGKENSEAYASLIASEAILYQVKGDYQKAEELFISGLILFQQGRLTKTKEYAALLNNYAVLEQLQGNFLSSRNLLLEVTEITRSQYGEESTITANAIENLAQVYMAIGDYSEAETLLLQILTVREKIYGKQHPVYAGNLLSLARLKQNQGAYNEAEPLFISARNIITQSQGKTSTTYAAASNALALFYQYLGNYATAEPLFIEARNIFKQLYGENNRDYATTIANLSTLYKLTGRDKEAIYLLKESISIDERLLGSRHPGYAVGLHNLASLYQKSGEYEQAKELFEKALTIYELSLGVNNPSYANTLNNIGVLYQDLKQFDKAEQAIKTSLEIRKKLFGQFHPDYAYSLYSLASFYQFTNRRAEAAPLFEEVITEYLRQVKEFFPSMSEKEKSAFYAKIRPVLESYQDFALEYYLESPNNRKEVLGKLYDLQLSTKALLLNASNKVRDRIMSGNDESLKTAYRNWINLKEEIVKYYSFSREELELASIDVKALEAQANTLEKELSAKSAVFADEFDKQGYSWKDVREVLKPEEIAIEIIRVKKKYIKDSVIYAALVVRQQSTTAPEVVIFPMGAQLEKRKYNYYRNTIKYNLSDTISHERFFQPIVPQLTGIKSIYLSVDGVFNKVNFNTLFNRQTDKYLLDEYSIKLVSNTNELLSDRSVKRNFTASIFGDPAFGYDSEFMHDISQRVTRSKLFDSFSGVIYDLPGTKEEADKLNKLLQSKSWNSNLFVRNDATVTNIKNVSNPQLLHIATHGFFLPDIEFENDPNFGLYSQNETANPLFRSGLLFAGSAADDNEADDDDNGVLTAYEAMNLNLDETELIVLSACETGLGEVRNGEGVYGLQRAFIVAGAKGIVMSLWKVDDETTQLLMNSFYEKWISGKDKLTAFEEAQKELKELHPGPYYWGAFVMLGK